MVADSRVTCGDTWYPMTKITRHADELIGFAGQVRDAKIWLKWYVSGKKGPRPKAENYGALVLRKDGLYDIGPDGLELLVERGFHGIGSGGGYAQAAFMAGAKALNVVQIACEIDSHSGGDIKVEGLKK